ncbi:MAG: hypothetical protein HY465_03825 [Deltaproteobacteria bacterium]|nr:hypothetical protein [Deltaproteobacteria bacterium]
MRRLSLEVVSLSGLPVELALELGRLRAKRIARAIEFWDRLLAKKFRGRRDVLRTLEQSFFRAACDYAPQYVSEIEAMAEGAGVPFRDLFRLNCTELHTYADEKCTTLIFPVQTKQGRRILVAHNEDWDPKRSDVFILRAALPGVSYVIVAYDGYLPGVSCGMNSAGLVHAVNFLKPADRRAGLPRIFITHHLVTAPNIDDCLKWIRGAKRAFGQSIHLAQGNRYVGIELTAKHMAIRRPKLPTAHSNHYLARSLDSEHQSPTQSSLLRYQTATRLLREGKNACEILSDQSDHPYSIWREADHPEDPAATLVMAMLQTGDEKIEVYRCRPDRSKGKAIRL